MGDNLNSDAQEWKPNASASEWQPSWLQPATTPAEAPAPAEPEATEEAAPAAAAAAADDDAAAAPSTNDDADASAEVTPGFKKISIGGSEEPSAEGTGDDAPGFKNVSLGGAPAEEENDGPKVVSSSTDQAVTEEDAPEPAPITHSSEPEVFDSKELIAELEKGKEMIKDFDVRPHLNVVTIGHVDAGKSTLSGSILYVTGKVDKRTIEKFEQEAKERNRESWFLAYIMDESEEERAKGKTVEVGRAYFETEDRRLTILDAPGHKNYVPAMISGASQADVGILVISARKGEFESGFIQAGQTREHAMLAKTLGIQKLIVCINKMDEQTVKWSKERYDDIVKRLRPFLKSSGFKVKRDVTFLPISALSGTNVKDPISKDVCAWAADLNDGKSLLDTLNDLSISGRDAEKPLRATIVDRYTDRGVVLMAKVEAGVLFVGQEVRVCPNQVKCKVESISINEEEVQGAKPGENVLVRLTSLNENQVAKGHVIASRFSPVQGCTEVIAQLFVVSLLEHRPLFSAGYNAVFHAHTAEEESTVYEIVAELDKTGKIAKRNPAFAKAGSTIICKIRLAKSICLEPYDTTMQLGRFTLRDEGSSIAIGIIKKCR
ncbi:Elongation factor 1-alpha [Hondaea fermentalgiana]|uniref:Elongation factor 1-alpha n=1 Tax=Hondaea fermentalgiana TaxID=2315210 RepID=A0A2R5GU12_9STRA|nr:Elongation factor 1-alpha [Hondaea fermentalgiana]|eukprot:GBG33809.1 Elongation factor 1-alpha [Hondaea fermentalgiana]